MKGTVLAHERTTFQGKRVGAERVGLGRIGVEAEASFFNRTRYRLFVDSAKREEDHPRREVSASLADTPPHRYADTFPPTRLRRRADTFPLVPQSFHFLNEFLDPPFRQLPHCG
jgi:hypothetical protein